MTDKNKITNLLPESLDESAKAEISNLFEERVNAALGEKLSEAMEASRRELETTYLEKFEAEKEELVENLSKFLENFTTEYIKENEVALRSNVKVSVQESFMEGLNKLFTEHYIEIPEDKIDVYAEAVEELETVTGKLNESVKSNLELNEEVKNLKKKNAIISESKNMTDTQAEKLSQLLENVTYNEDTFADTMKSIKTNLLEKKLDDKLEQSLFEEKEIKDDKITKPDYSSFNAFIKAAK